MKSPARYQPPRKSDATTFTEPPVTIGHRASRLPDVADTTTPEPLGAPIRVNSPPTYALSPALTTALTEPFGTALRNGTLANSSPASRTLAGPSGAMPPTNSAAMATADVTTSRYKNKPPAVEALDKHVVRAVSTGRLRR